MRRMRSPCRRRRVYSGGVQDVAAWLLVALTAGLGLLAVALEQPVRATACLVGAVVGAAGLAFLEGAGDLSVSLLTTVAAGGALLLLLCALLLNLTREETGGRRFRIQPTLILVVVVWVSWLCLREGGLPDDVAAPALPAGATSNTLFEVQGLPLALSGLVLLASMLCALLVARRRG